MDGRLAVQQQKKTDEKEEEEMWMGEDDQIKVYTIIYYII